MIEQTHVRTLIGDSEVESVDEALNELELSLVTVEDVIERNVEDAGESYIGVNLGLFVQHTKHILTRCRHLIQPHDGAQP